MKPMLLPNRPYSDELDLDQLRLCARMILDAYDMFEQWEKRHPDEADFVWKRPAPPAPGLVYGEPLWATFRYAERRAPRHPRDTDTVRWVDKPCPIGFLATAPGQVFVIFRGTLTDYEWVKVNFRFLQKDCDFDRFGDGCAHAGFLKYYRTIRKTLLKRLAALGLAGQQVVIAGHSLGGALSALAALDLAGEDHDGTTVHHVNFGAPRVFDARLARHYEGLPVTTFRVVNVEDVVTAVPLPALSELTFQHVGTPLCFSAQYGSVGDNHAMENYLYALEHPDAPQRG
jgi:hypothetical protein